GETHLFKFKPFKLLTRGGEGAVGSDWSFTCLGICHFLATLDIQWVAGRALDTGMKLSAYHQLT
ncbi:hypothetical protein, partial [Proteus mirabilis]|uniref:hypothetical protein n=1 Tax=Proteus mirabilis TaxID=584 RepID=UPI001C891C81